MSPSARASSLPVSSPPARAISPIVGLAFLGFTGAIQSSDPNIASTALLTAGTALHMGTLSALAASISTFILAASVITTGMLADRLGRKKVITVAFIVAIIGDVLVAMAPNTTVYLLGRAVVGIGLGCIYGAGFAYVRHFASGKGGLPAALGMYGAAGAFFTVLITFVGSSLVGIDWRIAFLVIPVLCAIALVAGLFVLPADGARVKSDSPWDAVGQVLLALGIVAFLYGISHATESLSSPLTLGPVFVGLLLFGLFYLWENRSGESAFFPVSMLKHPIFIAAVLAGLIYNLGNGALLLSFSNLFQYANNAKGLSLSLMQLPFLIAGIAAALLAGRLAGAGKATARALIITGALITAIGCAVFAATALARPSSLVAFIPALIIVGAGVITPSIPYGGLILQEADPTHFGVVSSSRTTIGQFWYALGLAGSTIVIDTFTRTTVKDKLGSSQRLQLNQWSISGQKPSDPQVLAVAAHAYSSAFAAAMAVLAATCLIAGIVAWLLLRTPTGDQPNPDNDPSAAHPANSHTKPKPPTKRRTTHIPPP